MKRFVSQTWAVILLLVGWGFWVRYSGLNGIVSCSFARRSHITDAPTNVASHRSARPELEFRLERKSKRHLNLPSAADDLR
jgi:hypothetical protein